MKRKMQIELLPCPFCGSKDIEHESINDARWLRCQNCSATGRWIWAKELQSISTSDPSFLDIWALETEKAWNTRPSPGALSLSKTPPNE